MIFETIFKQLRIENNLTAKDLASRLGFSKNIIYAWERGRAEPSYTTLLQIAKIFNVSIDYLLGNEDDFGNIVSKESNGAELSPAEWDFIRKVRTLDPRHFKVLQMQLETLTELQAESFKK